MKKIAFILMLLFTFTFLFSQGKGDVKNSDKKPQLTEREREELALLQQIKLVQNDPQKKAPLLEEFCKKFPDSQFIGWAHFQAVFTYQRLNKFSDMERHALIFMKMYPNEPSIPTLLTYGYAEKGKYEKALKLGEKTLKLIDSLKRPQNMPQSKWDGKVNNLKSILYSSLGEVDFSLGEKGKDKKKFKDSEKYFLKALKLNPKDDITNYRLGMLYYIENKNDKAKIYLSNAAVLNGQISNKAKETLIEILKSQKKEKDLNKILDDAKRRMGIVFEKGRIS